MATLEGQTIAGSYKDLLQVSNSNSGVDATARAVSDGEGTATLLYVSTTEVYSPGTGGSNNTAFGINAGDALATNGDSNTVYGAEAATALSTADRNVAIGHNAFYQATSGADDNVAIGYNTMSGGFGSNAVDDCVIIGSGAAAGVLTSAASGTVAVGKGALAALTSGQTNTAVGFMALNAEDTNQQNTAIGYNALLAQNGADSNTAIGREVGKTISTGGDNTLVGTNAALLLTTGARNTVLGAFAFDAAADTESDNVAIGYFAMGSCDQGTHADSDIDENVAIGSNALKGGDITDSEANVTGNVAIGYNAMDGTNTRSATGNTFVGQGSGGGTYTATVANNVGIGDGALSGALAAGADGTVAIGKSALAAITSGEGNTAVGYQALDATAQADSCTAIGYQALTDFDATNDGFHTFVGWKAGGALTGSSQNTGIGANAMGNQSNAIVGSNNVAVGFQAMTDATGDMNSNIAIGANTLKNLNGGDRNIAIGSGALDAADNVESDNIAIGEDALGQTDDNGALKNIAIGSYCMDQTFGTSYENTMIGYGAGGGAWEIAPSIRNTAVGYNCMGGGAMNSGNDNTAVGHGSLDLLTTGNDNACFGSNAGNSITTGSSNVMIGVGTDCGATDSNQVAIGIGVVNNAASQFRAGGSSNYLTYDFSSGGAVSITSDKRIKKDIRDGDLGLDFVNGLRPIKYVQKNEFDYPEEFKVNKNRERPLSPTMVQDGFIAQDVKSVADELGTTFSGWTEDANTRQELQYSKFVVPLVKAIQELSAKVKALEDAQ